jgi:hypothetical protein
MTCHAQRGRYSGLRERTGKVMALGLSFVNFQAIVHFPNAAKK